MGKERAGDCLVEASLAYGACWLFLFKLCSDVASSGVDGCNPLTYGKLSTAHKLSLCRSYSHSTLCSALRVDLAGPLLGFLWWDAPCSLAPCSSWWSVVESSVFRPVHDVGQVTCWRTKELCSDCPTGLRCRMSQKLQVPAPEWPHWPQLWFLSSWWPF